MTFYRGEYKEFKLDNGLRVAILDTGGPIFRGELVVKHGAINERDNESGLAHFLEHVLCDGSSILNKGSHNKILKRILYDYNASTCIDRTKFYTASFSENIEAFLELVSNNVLYPAIDKLVMDTERNAILREIADQRPRFLNNYKVIFERMLYPENIHVPFIAGKEEVIKSATLQELNAFYHRGYHPNNMDLLLVGGMPNNIKELVEKYFGLKPRGSIEHIIYPEIKQIECPHFYHCKDSSLLDHNNPEESNAKMMFGFITKPATLKDTLCLVVISELFCGSESIGFKRIRKDNGLAYYVSGSYNFPNVNVNDNGHLIIDIDIHAKRWKEGKEILLDIMGNLKTKHLDDDEINRLINHMRFSMMNSLQYLNSLLFAVELYLDRGFTPQQKDDLHKSLTAEDIKNAAIKYLPSDERDSYQLMLFDPHKTDLIVRN